MKKKYTTREYKKYHNKASVKQHLYELSRAGKEHTAYDYKNKDLTPISPFIEPSPKRTKKKIVAPSQFSFLFNTNGALEFFHNMLSSIDKGITSIIIDLREVQDMSGDVLVYIISLDNIFKNTGLKISIKIKAPKSPELRYLLLTCGLTKYFKANTHEKTVNEVDVFEICDKNTNENDGITCKDAVDFCQKYYDKKQNFFYFFNSLAELMTNTDQHAYPEDAPISNWYLYAHKVKSGVAFYFFDNGKGILKTAKKKLLEKVEELTFGLDSLSLLNSTLNGEFRSQTGKKYRNKGLPEINDFLTSESIEKSIILTNNIFVDLSLGKSKKLEYNFEGSFFIWIMKTDENLKKGA